MLRLLQKSEKEKLENKDCNLSLKNDEKRQR